MRIATGARRSIVAVLVISALCCAMAGAAAAETAAEKPVQVIQITAKRFEYAPNEITIKKGVPVVLEFTSLDRTHGFAIPDLGPDVRATIEPGKITQLRLTIPKAGVYEFHCDIFCGDGHEGMTGKIIVEE